MLRHGDRIGDWVVDRLIGEGGMGAVFRCHNVLSERMLAAVKVLKGTHDPEALTRFVREVEALEALRHPAVLQVRGGGLDAERGLAFLVMELLDGEDLSDRLARGPLPVDQALAVVRVAAEALAHAHRQGVAHRDVKPGNLFLCADGSVRVVDFGIALDTGRTRLTRTGLVPGTMPYLAPEVVRGGETDPRLGDVYALGLVLYEALTGERVFRPGEGLSDSAAVAQIVARKLESVAFDPGPGFSEAVRRAVRGATDPDPTRRTSSMDTFRVDLDAGDGLVSAPPTPHTAVPTARRASGGPTGRALWMAGGGLVAALAVAILVMVVVVGVVLVVRRSDVDPELPAVVITERGGELHVGRQGEPTVPLGHGMNVYGRLSGFREATGERTLLLDLLAGRELEYVHEALEGAVGAGFESVRLRVGGQTTAPVSIGPLAEVDACGAGPLDGIDPWLVVDLRADPPYGRADVSVWTFPVVAGQICRNPEALAGTPVDCDALFAGAQRDRCAEAPVLRHDPPDLGHSIRAGLPLDDRGVSGVRDAASQAVAARTVWIRAEPGATVGAMFIAVQAVMGTSDPPARVIWGRTWEAGRITRTWTGKLGDTVASWVRDLRHWQQTVGPADAGLARAGARRFEQNCVPCHRRGEDFIGPDLFDHRWIYGGSSIEVARSIAQGHPDKGCPAWRALLGDGGVAELVVFLRAESADAADRGRQGAPPDPRSP